MSFKKYHVDLTLEEQDYLKKVISRSGTSSLRSKRAYSLLACDRNGTLNWQDAFIADTYHLSIKSVERLRKRFVLESFEIALNGKKREKFMDKIFTGDIEAKLIALRCTDSPEGYNKWTFRLLADKMVELSYVETISHETVRQILKKTKLNLGE